MTSASRTDVTHADFQAIISRYLQNISTLFCTVERMIRTIIMQNSRLVNACFPIKSDEVWIDRFCVRYDWWRRLQPTSSVSPMCTIYIFISDMYKHMETNMNLNLADKFVFPDAEGELTTFKSLPGLIHIWIWRFTVWFLSCNGTSKWFRIERM